MDLAVTSAAPRWVGPYRPLQRRPVPHPWGLPAGWPAWWARPAMAAVALRRCAKLRWPEETAPVLTVQQERCISSAITRKFNFRRLTTEEMKELKLDIQKNEELQDLVLSDKIIYSYRSAAQMRAALKFTYRSKRDASRLSKARQAAEAENSLALPRLSRELVLPPTTILKAMQLPEDLPAESPFQIFNQLEQLDGFASVEDAENLLFSTDKSSINGWFLRELLWAFENDFGARQQVMAKTGAAFEESVAAYCGKAGVPIQREEDLRGIEGMVTPDVLFASPVTFQLASGSERNLRWLECKSFHAGSEDRKILKNLKQQAEKYAKALGPGAVVFAGGATERVRDSLEQLGVTTLDGSDLSPESQASSVQFVAGPKAKFWQMPYEALFGRNQGIQKARFTKSGEPRIEKTPSANAEKMRKMKKKSKERKPESKTKKSKESKPEARTDKVSSTRAKRKSQRKKASKKSASQEQKK